LGPPPARSRLCALALVVLLIRNRELRLRLNRRSEWQHGRVLTGDRRAPPGTSRGQRQRQVAANPVQGGNQPELPPLALAAAFDLAEMLAGPRVQVALARAGPPDRGALDGVRHPSPRPATADIRLPLIDNRDPHTQPPGAGTGVDLAGLL